MSNADYKHKDRPVDLQLGHHVELDVAVLAADVWAYVDSYMQLTATPGNPSDRALFFWRQAEHFAANLRGERYEASPLHLYYMMLNATKALLVVRGLAPPITPPTPAGAAPTAPDDFSQHGVTFSPTPQPIGHFPGQVELKRKGVCALLAKAMGDTPQSSYTLEELVSSVVCVHRAYGTLRHPAGEKFIPVHGPFRLKQVTGGGPVFFEAWLPKHVPVTSVSTAMPQGLECGTYPGVEPKNYIRQKQRKPAAIVGTTAQFSQWHAALRRRVHVIAGRSAPSYYVGRSDTPPVGLSQLTLNFAVAFALSSLARYHPETLHQVLNRDDGWVIKEYLCTTPHQFLALISGEITGRIIQRPYSDLR